VIAPSSGRLVAKAVRRSRDRGRNSHRILRRVLTDGRHPRSFQVSSFTGWRRRDLGGFLPHPTAREGATTGREEGEATGVSEARSAPCVVGRQHPRSRSGQKPGHEVLVRCRSAEAITGVVKRSDPRLSHAEPQNPRDLHTAKAVTASREHQRCGYTQVVWVAEVDRTHRASSLPGGRKASWKSRALA